MYFVTDARHIDIRLVRGEVQAILEAFHLQSEVRLAYNNGALAPVLNTLAEAGTKFYLIHLPGNAGWVIRRHRPTGEFYGTHAPAAAVRDTAHPDLGSSPKPAAAPAVETGAGSAPAHPGDHREYAEEYFGLGDPARPGLPAAHPSDEVAGAPTDP